MKEGHKSNDGDGVTNQKKKKKGSGWARTGSCRRSVTKQMAQNDGDEVTNPNEENE